MDGPRRETVRMLGTLVSFNNTRGWSHAYVRVGDEVLFAPTNVRGTLEGSNLKKGTIHRCINGDRYYRVEAGTPIAVDVNFDVEGKKPIVTGWAPKPQH